MKTICLLFASLIFFSFNANAQSDSLKLDLAKAEQLFLSKNYQLLAANYNIGQAQAEIITAKLFDNPEFGYENLLYNHETKRFLETSFESGQYATDISQLFKLAGKRKKSIQLAQSGVKIAEHEYEETLRNLRFELRDVFYKAYYNHQSAQIFQQEIAGSEKLLKAYQQQFTLGNVAQKDVIRIQSLLINLRAELNELQDELEDNYRDLKILCNITANINLNLVLNVNESISVEKLAYNTLIDSAKINRSDYKLAKSTLQFNEANLKLQKAMAIPDLQVSLSYDLKGNYPEKYTGLGVRIPIPLFNRNKGEIKKAKIGIEAANNDVKSYEAILENEVFNSYKTALRAEQQYQAIDPKFGENFNKLMAGISENFKNRNISLIEFLDFYNSYKETALKLNQLKYQRLSSREEINFVTGTKIFN